MALEKLSGRNFQNHRRADLELGPDITTIVGPNDSGKSALIRLLRWVALNRAPAAKGGRSFVHDEATFALGTITVDGKKVVRKTAKGKNLYKLDGRVFKALGSNVPQEVADLLKLGPASFAGQHSLPYWFSETPGQVSKQLNEVVNLELIDRALGNIAAGVRRTKAEKEVSEGRLKEARRRARELRYVEQLSKDFARLEELYDEWDHTRQKAEALQDLLRQAHAAGETADRLTAAAEEAATLVKLAGRSDRASQEAEGLGSLLGNLRQKEQERCDLERQYRVGVKRLKRKAGKACPLCGQPFPSSAASR